MAAGLLAPGIVLADGDPASDVLASQAVYVPGDGGFAPSQTAQLSALVAEAQRAGVPIRVALIATQADLGSVTELWRQPRNYARFLGQELAQVYRGTLIVAMPAGFGIVSVGGAPARGQVGVAADHGPLVPATMRVVQAVAATDGHRLALPRAAVVPGSASALGLSGPRLVAGAGCGRGVDRRGLDRQPARPRTRRPPARPATGAVNG